MKAEQFNFNIGPFDLFSSTIGGLPIILFGFLTYYPIKSINELIPIISKYSSISMIAILIIMSYLLGSLIQNITWQYFKVYCKVTRKQHSYLGDLMMEKIKRINNSDLLNVDEPTIDFEDRLSLLIVKKVGKPKKIRWLEARILPFIRQNDPISASIIDTYLANHIMYRNLSFGFFLIFLVSIVNIFRVSSFTLEQLILVLLFFIFSFMAGRKAVDFRVWRNRDLYIGFYHLAQVK